MLGLLLVHSSHETTRARDESFRNPWTYTGPGSTPLPALLQASQAPAHGHKVKGIDRERHSSYYGEHVLNMTRPIALP